MAMSFLRSALLLVAMGTSASPVSAQVARLPIADGIWVKAETACGTAAIAYVKRAGRFGSVYFYGPNQSMGPANETEVVSHVGRGENGFSVINDGPIEVAARPNGRAVVRAFSLSEGVQWTENIRLCAPTTLSAKLRAGLARVGLGVSPR
ncbi:hypothetical protein [Novosphingobium lentum]|uniref:hypothetical protein n=1 Tax=Novosphingobium lentum TaxID=145287 RepID=UPI000AD72344|nr:hypothetical protein [Novosphingobium lentum]